MTTDHSFVFAASFAPDGSFLATANEDGTAKVFRL